MQVVLIEDKSTLSRFVFHYVLANVAIGGEGYRAC